jgi:hypothetical protein
MTHLSPGKKHGKAKRPNNADRVCLRLDPSRPRYVDLSGSAGLSAFAAGWPRAANAPAIEVEAMVSTQPQAYSQQNEFRV